MYGTHQLTRWISNDYFHRHVWKASSQMLKARPHVQKEIIFHLGTGHWCNATSKTSALTTTTDTHQWFIVWPSVRLLVRWKGECYSHSVERWRGELSDWTTMAIVEWLMNVIPNDRLIQSCGIIHVTSQKVCKNAKCTLFLQLQKVFVTFGAEKMRQRNVPITTCLPGDKVEKNTCKNINIPEAGN